MLLVDEVLELEPGERVVALKRVTDENCAGHFPGNPIMPGVLMVEALAQTGAVAVLSQEENRGRLALFAGIDDVRFKRIVRPGRRAAARMRARDGARARSGAARRARPSTASSRCAAR